MKLPRYLKYNGLILIGLWVMINGWSKEQNSAINKTNIQPKLTSDTIFTNDKFLPEVEIESAVTRTSYKKSTGSYAVLKSDKIRNKSMVWWDEQLNSLPGVFMQQGALNTNRITIRGVGSRSPYSTTRIKTYWNNIPFTNLDGATALESVAASQIDKIEVTKGPSAVNFGAGLGGVINLYSSKKLSPTSYSAEFGDFGSSNHYIATSLGDSLTHMTINYGTTASNGYRQHSNFDRKNISLMAFHNTGIHSFALHFLNSGITAQIPSSLNSIQVSENRYMAAPNWYAIKGYETSRHTISGFTWHFRCANKIENKATLFYKNNNAFERRPFNTLADKTKAYGLRNKTTLRLSNWELNLTTELQREKYSWEIYDSRLDNSGDLLYDNADTKSNLNIGFLAALHITDKLNLDAGASLNLQHYKLKNPYNTRHTYWFAPIASPSIGLNYAVNSLHNLYLSASSGFSYPTLEETLLPEGNFNKELEPEKGWVYEIGWRLSALNKRWHSDLGIYYMDINNLLVTKRETEDIFYQINAGKTSHWGVEFTGQSILTDNTSPVEAVLSYTLWSSINTFKTFVDEGVNYANKKLPGIPSYSGNTELNISFKNKFNFKTSYAIIGKQYLDDNNLQQLKAFGLIHFRLGYNFSLSQTRGIVFIGVNNSFDKTYNAMIVPNAVGFGGNSPRYFYPGTPRYVYCGMRLSLRQ